MLDAISIPRLAWVGLIGAGLGLFFARLALDEPMRVSQQVSTVNQVQAVPSEPPEPEAGPTLGSSIHPAGVTYLECDRAKTSCSDPALERAGWEAISGLVNCETRPPAGSSFEARLQVSRTRPTTVRILPVTPQDAPHARNVRNCMVRDLRRLRAEIPAQFVISFRFAVR